MRNPFARLAKRDTARPSLRERAALLKASASRVIRRKLVEAEPADPLGAMAPDASSDPILPMIEEGRRLLLVYLDAHATIPQDPTTIEPPEEWGAAGRALWAHIDNTILKTVPRTAAGCRELARFADEYFEANEVPISDDEMAVLRLIAQSPLWGGSAEPSACMDWPALADGPDTELLALGCEFDALHAQWVRASVAGNEAEDRANALYDDLVQRKGWTPLESIEVALAQPGTHEAIDANNAVNIRIERVMASIRALPARTLDGLAVKARAAIPGIWRNGQYQEGAGLGDDEDWSELNARSVIEECLSLAGVDWTGRCFRDEAGAPAGTALTASEGHSAVTPKASADAVNLSGLGINDLCSFYEKLGAARALWSGAMCEPRAETERCDGHFVRHTPFGERAGFEDTRAGFLMDRIVVEASGQTPSDKWEGDNLLALRIQHEIACEGRVLDPTLMADIARTWG